MHTSCVTQLAQSPAERRRLLISQVCGESDLQLNISQLPLSQPTCAAGLRGRFCLQTIFKTFRASRLAWRVRLAPNCVPRRLSVHGSGMVGGRLGRACGVAERDDHKQ